MIKYSLFLFFILAVNAHNWDILKIVEENIDDNGNPCDDFYRHVCTKSGSNDLTWRSVMNKGYKEDLEEIVKKYIPKKLMESIEKLVDFSKNGFPTEPIEQIAEKYVEICETNSTKTYIFLKKLEQFIGLQPNEPCRYIQCFSNLAFDSNYQRASKILAKGAGLWLNKLIFSGTELIENFAKIYENGVASIWALRHQDEFRQISEMFAFFKEELLKLIEKTPWLLNTESMEAYRSIASQMYYTLPNVKIGKTLEHVFNYQISYDDCIRTYEVLDDIATQYCVIHLLQGEEDYSLNQHNAYNSHPEVVLYNTFVNLMSNKGSLALKYGAVGAALAHEIGHSVIMGDTIDGYYPYYSEEESCYVFDAQIDENGSDIFGFPFAYDRLKRKMGDEIYETTPESKRGLTHTQAYFHLVFLIGCRRGDNKGSMAGTHGSDNIRINAGVIQASEFEKVFKCSKDSRMVQSRKQQCHTSCQHAIDEIERDAEKSSPREVQQ